MTSKRIVTGRSEDGKPRVLFRGEPPSFEFGTTQSCEIWATGAAPADPRARHDAASGEWRLEPPRGGSVFRVVTFQPGAEVELHATATVDCMTVIAGMLTLILPDEEIVLRPGDTVVQQATPHGWANRSNEPCTVSVVLLSASEEDA